MKGEQTCLLFSMRIPYLLLLEDRHFSDAEERSFDDSGQEVNRTVIIVEGVSALFKNRN